MRTKYLDIEAITIYDQNNVSIASNIMLEGFNYDEPIYTNIFCQKTDLEIILKEENNKISKEILSKLNKTDRKFQIDIPDLQDHLYSWKLQNNYQLEAVKNEEVPFTCYNLKL